MAAGPFSPQPISLRAETNMAFKITLQPGNHTFVAEAGETILEAARRNGHELPRGCNDGACRMCVGDVLHGTVDHGRSTWIALPQEDREAGMALFCCARPMSDLVIERRETSADWDMLEMDSSPG
jgi:CDP-4-dehydro-6-deoxyglucose reductase